MKAGIIYLQRKNRRLKLEAAEATAMGFLARQTVYKGIMRGLPTTERNHR